MSADQAHHDTLAHPVPMKILIGVIVALLILTWLTLAATWIDLGPLNIWLALAIAVVKASFVLLYFMHLRWDNLFHAIVIIGALLFVILFIGGSLADTAEYQPNVTSTPTNPTRSP